MTDILIPKQNVILDATVLSTLMSCARLTDFRFNLHLVSTTGKSKSLEMGSIVHTYLENFYKCQINGLKREQALGTAYTAALDYARSAEVNNASEDEIQWALSTCEQYTEHYKNDYWTSLEVEVVKQEVVYEDDEIRIMWKAKLDWVVDTLQGIFPVDHKTMSQRRASAKLNNQFIGQCLVMKTRGMFVNKIGFQKTLKPEEKFERVLVPYSADVISEWQSTILPYYAKFMLMYNESGYWPPNYTHCENKYGFCQFKEVCESDRGMREEVLGHNFIVGKAWDPSDV